MARITKKQSIQEIENIVYSKKIDNNTFRLKDKEGIEYIRLHLTNIITFTKDKTILNTGGWKTSTTENRINKYSGFSIYSKKGIWHITTNKGDFLFYDNITFDKKAVC